jgi:hypothetical protein
MEIYNSYGLAQKVLKEFFSDTPHSDEVSFDELVRVTGRTAKTEAANRQYISNKLSILRSYNLIDTIYVTDGRRKVSSIKLTPEGMKAIGRSSEGLTDNTIIQEPETYMGGRDITLESVLRDVKVLRKQLPSFSVELIIKPKEDSKKISIQ